MASPFMTYFHEEIANGGFLSVKFNFDYMDQQRKAPDSQPKLVARYQGVVGEVISGYQPKHLVIGGKSMGGRVASYVAGDISGVSGLVFLGYPLHPPGKPQHLRDEHLYNLTLPMLFISGTNDPFAGRDLLDRVVGKLGSRATLIWVEGGDHSLKRRSKNDDSLRTAVDAIVTWVRKLK
jgi:predicted alpha/beta-hydrolase family hydrolase